MANIIEASKITKVYNPKAEEAPALSDVNFAIERGESVAIIGKSGSGKSTLMHIMALLDKPTDGDLYIDGKSSSLFNSTELADLRNKKFGFVFQQFFLNARNTCLENVTLPLNIMGIGKSERNKRGLVMLEKVGLLDKAKQKAGDLSGGQKQRLCIARALITEPEVIFADEPTGNLDTENGKIITDLLFQMQKEKGITLIIVTHDPDLAKLCGRAITIKDGRIIQGA